MLFTSSHAKSSYSLSLSTLYYKKNPHFQPPKPIPKPQHSTSKANKSVSLPLILSNGVRYPKIHFPLSNKTFCSMHFSSLQRWKGSRSMRAFSTSFSQPRWMHTRFLPHELIWRMGYGDLVYVNTGQAFLYGDWAWVCSFTEDAEPVAAA